MKMNIFPNTERKNKILDIVIIADFCGQFDGSSNNRFAYIAEELSRYHKVEIITSDFSHGLKAYFPDLIEKFSYKVTMLHERKYKKNICISRFLAHYIWGRNVKKYLKKRKFPDIVYCAMPTLTAAFYTAKYCERYSIRFIIDVQDLWPEAFQMILNIPIISKIIFKPFELLADGIYKRADDIIAVSQTYVNRALSVNKKNVSGHSVFLGTNLLIFDNNVSNTQNSSMIKKIKDQKDGKMWIAYCGTLGSSYDLCCVIDAIELLNNMGYNNIKFIIMGDGPRREEFEKYVGDKQVDAYFTGRLPYYDMCGILSLCDMAVNPIVHGAAQSIINKHADYASAGLSVISTQENSEYRELVDYYNMGINCKNGNARDMAEKIRIILEDSNMRITMGNNARKCAEEMFDRRYTYKEIINVIEGETK